MKVRIKFVKTGSMRFLGHLDLMRYFQKAIRRCGLPVMYSTGYSPHQLISFASPLGLGLTSEGEYMDAQLESYVEPEKLVAQLNEGMNDEIFVTEASYVSDRAHPTMARVSASDYLIYAKRASVSAHDVSRGTAGSATKELPGGNSSLSGHFQSVEDFQKRFSEFLSQETIIVEKKTKKNTITMDLKSMIYLVGWDTPEKRVQALSQVKNQPAIPTPEWAFTVETEYDETVEYLHQLPHIYLRVSCGSVVNIKPEQVMEAFYQWCGMEFDKLDYCTHRIELYADELENTKETVEERAARQKRFISILEDEKE